MFDRELMTQFFESFRQYLPEYVRESVYETVVAEILIKGTIELFSGNTPGIVKLKNQGSEPCYISTANLGGYRLDPGERIDFFVNRRILATTVSGTTTIGFVKY